MSRTEGSNNTDQEDELLHIEGPVSDAYVAFSG